MEEEYIPWIVYLERRKCEGVYGIMQFGVEIKCGGYAV